MRETFTAGSTAQPDDVILLGAGVPYAMRLFEVKFYISNPVPMATLQLRDYLNGGGNALSELVVTSTIGMVRSRTTRPIPPGILALLPRAP